MAKKASFQMRQNITSCGVDYMPNDIDVLRRAEVCVLGCK